MSVQTLPVQPANGVSIEPGVPFKPEVVIDDASFPLCGHGFESARNLCKGFGFPFGGQAVLTNEVFDVDALNDRGELGTDERCKAGNAAGIEIVCHAKVSLSRALPTLNASYSRTRFYPPPPAHPISLFTQVSHVRRL